jgi:hypothetical protein
LADKTEERKKRKDRLPLREKESDKKRAKKLCSKYLLKILKTAENKEIKIMNCGFFESFFFCSEDEDASYLFYLTL